MVGKTEVGGPSPWTGAATARLTELWGSGKSSSIVADMLTTELGVKVTRNMVIGKTNRLGLLKGHKNKSGAGERKSPSTAARKRTKAVPGPKKSTFNARRALELTLLSQQEQMVIPVFAAVESMGEISILELGADTCRAVLRRDESVPGWYVYCGKVTRIGSPYCEDHHRRHHYIEKNKE